MQPALSVHPQLPFTNHSASVNAVYCVLHSANAAMKRANKSSNSECVKVSKIDSFFMKSTPTKKVADKERDDPPSSSENPPTHTAAAKDLYTCSGSDIDVVSSSSCNGNAGLLIHAQDPALGVNKAKEYLDRGLVQGVPS